MTKYEPVSRCNLSSVLSEVKRETKAIEWQFGFKGNKLLREPPSTFIIQKENGFCQCSLKHQAYGVRELERCFDTILGGWDGTRLHRQRGGLRIGYVEWLFRCDIIAKITSQDK